MRGKVIALPVPGNGVRITPAYAGKSIEVQPYISTHRDHPRLCGEKQSITEIALSVTGSPPPMRGKGVIALTNQKGGGITPAYAGKSASAAALNFSRSGSPPPMRGKVELISPSPSQSRITPAYAGKSSVLREPVLQGWDHPRLCGEK